MENAIGLDTMIKGLTEFGIMLRVLTTKSTIVAALKLLLDVVLLEAEDTMNCQLKEGNENILRTEGNISYKFC